MPSYFSLRKGPGAWNDPDMLGVGMPGITDVEGRSQFSLWCILGAPLMLGTDLRNMSTSTLDTISNVEAISINQDASMEGVRTFSPAGDAPVPTVPSAVSAGEYFFLNQTYCRDWGTTWVLNTTTGHEHFGMLQNMGSPLNQLPTGICMTIASFSETERSCVPVEGVPVVAGLCRDTACNYAMDGVMWSFNGSRVVLNHATHAWPNNTWCVEAVDPSVGPPSQFILNKCRKDAPPQEFSYADYTGRLSLPLGTFGRKKFAGGQPCIGAFAPNDVDMFLKRMNNGDVALAVLNRRARAGEWTL